MTILPLFSVPEVPTYLSMVLLLVTSFLVDRGWVPLRRTGNCPLVPIPTVILDERRVTKDPLPQVRMTPKYSGKTGVQVLVKCVFRII